MRTALELPIVGYGFVVELLRRLPLLGGVFRRTTAAAIVLVTAAVVSFIVWGAQAAPQRVTIADLVVGNISTAQTWIIVSGDASLGSQRADSHRYVLTDAAAPNARINILSEVGLTTGPLTVSGHFVGGREQVPLGYPWVGTLRADPVLVDEPGPPWLSFGLIVASLGMFAAGRVSHPMFFARRPGNAALEPRTMSVSVRHDSAPRRAPGEAVLTVAPGSPLTLRPTGAPAEALRLHSVHSGAEVGQLRHVASSEPALRMRRASDEITLSFATANDRDIAYAALVADAAGWSPATSSRKYQAAT